MELHFLADRVEAVPVVARWYFNKWGHRIEGNSFENTCEKIRGMLNRERPPLHIVAVEQCQILGVARFMLREMDGYPHREHWLGGVYVAPYARRAGIAAKLVLRIVEIARSYGAKELYLQTERTDGGLYARLGWMPLERTHYQGVDVLVMVKKLTP